MDLPTSKRLRLPVDLTLPRSLFAGAAFLRLLLAALVLLAPLAAPGADKPTEPKNGKITATPHKKNAPPKASPQNSATNAPTTNSPALSALKQRVATSYHQLRANRAFWPSVGAGAFVLLAAAATVAVLRLRKRKALKAKTEAALGMVSTPAAGMPRKLSASKTAIHTCNLLHLTPETQHVWQFEARGGGFSLNREQDSAAGQSLAGSLIQKEWNTLWQRKLNIAWLPSEHVFLRVVQLPKGEFAETLSMVELQLEKLSPMPVTQIVWTLQILPHPEPAMQTVVVIMALRNIVEEFLGKLESVGYLADRLDLPILDQLQARTLNQDGVWIYPGVSGPTGMALVAWWCGGTLQNLELLTLPPANAVSTLKEQLLQMAWSGEVEGWLSGKPQWYLVADTSTAATWEEPLRQALELPLQLEAPASSAQLAALNAQRAAQAELQSNLLPAEFSLRYHQQFVDRLWMRSLGALVALYLVGLLVYAIALGFATYRTHLVERQVVQITPEYTKALELKARYTVLRDRQDLKYAALDCYRLVAEYLPAEATLDGLNFSDGRKVSLTGTIATDKVKILYDSFELKLRKALIAGQPFFDPARGENLSHHVAPNGTNATWTMSLELKRSEDE